MKDDDLSLSLWASKYMDTDNHQAMLYSLDHPPLAHTLLTLTRDSSQQRAPTEPSRRQEWSRKQNEVELAQNLMCWEW